MASSIENTADTLPESTMAAIHQDMRESAALPAALNATAQQTRALAKKLGYEGPLAPDLLEEGARESLARINFEVFSVGARLLLIKEQCPHGEFIERLDRLGLETRLAQRMMSATRKFPNAAISPHLSNLGKSKILELVVLDDEEAEAFANGEDVRGIPQDEIERMSVSELRHRLRLAKSSKDKLLADKTLKIENQARELDELGKKARFVATATPQERHEGIRTELLGYAAAVEGLLAGKLKPCFTALKKSVDDGGGEVDAYLSSTLGQIERAVRELREEFGLLRAEDVAWASE